VLKELLTTFVVSASAAGVDVTPHDATQYLEKQATCLARNMYHEARSQGLAGQLAVSLVVLNRVRDDRYPNTICEVVHQGPVRESWKTRGKNVPESARKYYPIRHQCQFSWYCDGKADTISKHDTEIFARIYDLSELILNPNITLLDITDGATHYHADYVYPEWRKSKTKTVEIGDHIFYRWEK